MHNFSISGYNHTVAASKTLFRNDELISDGERGIIQLVFGIILLTPISLLGITGNSLSLIVLRSQKNKTATNYCLIALAVSDLLLLLNALLFSFINMYVYESPREGTNFRLRLFPVFGLYTSLVTARITSMLTTLLSIERFVAVHFPIKAKLICNKKVTLTSILLIYGVTLVLFIPFPFKYNVVSQERNNVSFIRLTKNPNFSEAFIKSYGLAMNILFRFSPIVIILLLNIKIMMSIKKTHKRRDSISSRSDGHTQEQGRITVMLLVVTFTFVLGILPGAINSLLQMTWKGYSRIGSSRNFQQSFSYITFLLEAINSALNFLIYMALSARFRARYKEIFHSFFFFKDLSFKRFKNQSSIFMKTQNNANVERNDDVNPCMDDFGRNDSSKSLLDHQTNKSRETTGTNGQYKQSGIYMSDLKEDNEAMDELSTENNYYNELNLHCTCTSEEFV